MRRVPSPQESNPYCDAQLAEAQESAPVGASSSRRSDPISQPLAHPRGLEPESVRSGYLVHLNELRPFTHAFVVDASSQEAVADHVLP